MSFWHRIRGWISSTPTRTEQAAPESSSNEQDAPALVLLLPQPRPADFFTASYLQEVIAETCSVRFDERQGQMVSGEIPEFTGQWHSRQWSISVGNTPFFEDPVATAAAFKEQRVAQAVRDHKGWLAIRLIRDAPGPADDPYRTLGPLAVALAEQPFRLDLPEGLFPEMNTLRLGTIPNSRALAIYWPPGRQLRVFDEAAVEHLTGPDPLSIFRELHLSHAPVLQARNDDPRLVAAVEEARQRWPEFLAALNHPQPGQAFTVKVPLHEGDHLEYLWLTDVFVDGDQIGGRVGNTPIALTRLHLGDTVRLPQQTVADWAILEEGNMRGGFSIRALKEIGQEQ